MNKKTLNGIFAEYLFQVPDYQRGYAWEEQQLKDFIQDLDALVEDNVKSHYTGTLVVYTGRDNPEKDYGTDRLKIVDVVDGQQRLTSVCLYLSVILRALIARGKKEYQPKIASFLYSGATCKLTLNNETGDLFYDLLKTGQTKTPPQTPHAKRLVVAHERFKNHIDKQLNAKGDKGVVYLQDLCAAFSQRLNFTYYEIEEECEIGMTFELMNSRGKGLSVLELLKNYLMYWVSRNGDDVAEKNTFTTLINKNWKACYSNLGACGGDEDQCLRVAWTLYCSYTPANWHSYSGFKEDAYIPLRDFSKRTKQDTKVFIEDFVEGLAEISKHYATVIDPTLGNTDSSDELLWLTKIHHTGNIANFLPLMVAARKHWVDGSVAKEEYIALLKSMECYAYRVFLTKGKRSNAGKSNFYRWGFDVLHQNQNLPAVIAGVHALTRYYAPEESYISENDRPSDWYATRHRLRYTLFEYELHLLSTEGKGKQPQLKWEHLTDSTFEHILPQRPEEQSGWNEDWDSESVRVLLHDIGNLVLTQNNSNYLNFDFSRKKGKAGQSPSYANSDIRQERKISSFHDWTPKTVNKRRRELIAWINQRWMSEAVTGAKALDVVDEADEDGVI